MLEQSGAPAPQAPGTGSALAALKTPSDFLVSLLLAVPVICSVSLEVLSGSPLLLSVHNQLFVTEVLQPQQPWERLVLGGVGYVLMGCRTLKVANDAPPWC